MTLPGGCPSYIANVAGRNLVQEERRIWLKFGFKCVLPTMLQSKVSAALAFRAGVLKLRPMGDMQLAKDIYPVHRVFLPLLPVLLSSQHGPQRACVECSLHSPAPFLLSVF